jgi:hypothetical protein
MASDRTTQVYISPDLKDVLRLKSLIGEDTVRGFGSPHPLDAGFRAAEKELKATEALSREDKLAIGDLKLFTRAIYRHEREWMASSARFRSDLINPEECVSIRFELHVITFIAQPNVQEVVWTHYNESAPDIQTNGPEMAIECTLHRSSKTFRIQNTLEAKRLQHRGLKVPLVIAIGFEPEFTQEEIDKVANDANGLRAWFEAHPDVSAGLILTPSRPSEQVGEMLGHSTTEIRHGSCTQVVHHKAERPLPPGFVFGR